MPAFPVLPSPPESPMRPTSGFRFFKPSGHFRLPIKKTPGISPGGWVRLGPPLSRLGTTGFFVPSWDTGGCFVPTWDKTQPKRTLINVRLQRCRIGSFGPQQRFKSHRANVCSAAKPIAGHV